MVKRVIKKNGDEIFPLGFGCMRFPTKNGSIDVDVSKELIFRAIDGGVNYLDTAYSYHNYSSESFLGEILNTADNNGILYRDKVKIATKFPSWLVKSREDMENFLTKQLNNLQTDSIDYYYAHNVDLTGLKRLESLGLYDFLSDAKSKGLIKNVGFSYHGIHNEFNETVDHFDWDVCLVQYNYLDTNIQAGYDGIKYAYSKGLGVFIMGPLKGGLLARDLPKTVENLFRENNSNSSNAEWALSWVLNHEEITCVLSGMESINVVNECLDIANKVKANSLSDDELNTISKAQEIIQSLLKVNCTTCGYCMPCPKGVNIPECFSIYNDKFLFNKKRFGPLSGALLNYYMILGGLSNKKASAGLCNGCGKCKKLCPQSIDIPKELKMVKKEFEKVGFNYQVSFIKKIGLPFVTSVSNFLDFFKNF